MTVSIKITGKETLLGRLRRFVSGMNKPLEDASYEAAQLVADRAREGILNPPKSGILYKRYRPVRVVQASAPGEYPANDLGNLLASISVRKFSGRFGDVGASVGSDAVYALYLEFGTSRMAPRPFLQNAVDDSADDIPAAFRKHMRTHYGSL